MALIKVYCMLWVADTARAARFYKEVFGLDEAYTSPDWTELRFGDAVIALHSRGEVPQRHTGLGFQVSDIDATVTALKSAGGSVVAGPTERRGEGIRLADCADLDGNRFSVSQEIA
jgi:predicted enzyme related to lactoylglutathione lyase